MSDSFAYFEVFEEVSTTDAARAGTIVTTSQLRTFKGAESKSNYDIAHPLP
jgi:hypothetical protein